MKSLFVALVFTAVAAPAFAQSPAGSLSSSSFTPGLTPASAPAAGAAQGSGRARSSSGVFLKGQAGLIFGGDEVGFLIGVGGEGRPFDSKAIEVNADANFSRIAGDNGLYVSGNGLYHFDNDSKVDPFVGAGLGISVSGDTDAFPQIVGGLDFKRTRRPVRAEVRFLLPEGSTTTVLAVSIGLGR